MSIRHCALALALAAAAGFGVSPVAHAQLFAGYVVAGANANQVNGDLLAGYNRLGARAGIGVYSDLSDRWRWSLEIAYTQHGSSASARETRRMLSIYDKIGLQYASVPVSIHYMDWLSADAEIYHLEFVAGLAYNRLIRSEVIGTLGDDLTDARPYSDNVVTGHVGAYYAWSLKWAAGLVYVRGVNDAQAIDSESRQSLEQLSFRLRRTF